MTDDFESEIEAVAVEVELRHWRETLEAIDAAELGEVIPAEKVFAWLDTWGR